MKKIFLSLAIILLVYTSLPSLANDEQLYSLSGVFYHHTKALLPYYIIVDGTEQRFDLKGDILKDLKGGTRILVKGKLKTDLYDNRKDPYPAMMPLQWIIYMEVKEYKIIDKPFGFLKLSNNSLQRTGTAGAAPVAELDRYTKENKLC